MRSREGFDQRPARAPLHLSHPGSTDRDGMTEAPVRPFERIGPARPVSPVVLSVPHAGRNYRSALLAEARVPRATLELLEDRLADTLIWRAVQAGATAFVATAPRAEIDLNRDEREIDPSLIDPPPAPALVLPSARARAGIGLLPSRIAGAGALWRGPIAAAELARRIESIHRPYHAALADALAQARERFGAAVLLDCHSMPPRSPESGEPRIVFGDLHGTSARHDLAAAAVAAAGALGYSVGRNRPYAGGHVVGRHGAPGRGIHAIQIEIDRSLYLDAALTAPGPGFGATCRLLASVAAALEAALIGESGAIAAE